jgi:hypothetical protein
MWTVWRERFGWPHLCPVVWADPEGYVLVMRRAIQDVTHDEIVAFEAAWMDSQRLPLPSGEDKPEDWGHVDGRLVLCDYGYGCSTEEAIERERKDLMAALQRWGHR